MEMCVVQIRLSGTLVALIFPLETVKCVQFTHMTKGTGSGLGAAGAVWLL